MEDDLEGHGTFLDFLIVCAISAFILHKFQGTQALLLNDITFVEEANSVAWSDGS